jgi:hypothetical protein
MAKKRSPIKMTPESVIIAILLTWATFISVQELLGEFTG